MALRAASLPLALVLWSPLAWAAPSWPVSAPPVERGSGLLFHASFDGGVEADFAQGSSMAFMADSRDPKDDPGESVPGVFGAARTAVAGSFDALANVVPERGTVSFFLRRRSAAGAWDPLQIRTVDSYYWGTYLRISYWRARLSAWIPNETYHVLTTAAPSAFRIEENRWYHIALAWDQAYGAVLYVDGRPVGSSWGQRSWVSRGVDPAELALAWRDGATEYDELYVFDRPLPAELIRRLAEQNRPPSMQELPSLDFDPRRQANRRQELGWEGDRSTLPRLAPGSEEQGATVVRQVLPVDARALLAEAGAVFDGKLGEGWPRAPNAYDFNRGNGLSVLLEEPWDFAVLEGRADGRWYAGRHLTEPTEQLPLEEMTPRGFLTRWRLPGPRTGWMTFFWNRPDGRERVRVGELGFFRLGASASGGERKRRFYLRPATIGAEELASELTGRFGPGDRGVLGVDPEPPRGMGGQLLRGLRFHHLLLPPADKDWGLQGLRFVWWMGGALADIPFRVELRDPTLPGRRLFAFDAVADASPGAEPTKLELTLDLADRIVAAGRPLWLIFVFERDVELLWDGSGRDSYVEVFEGTPEEALGEFSARELPFVRSRFRMLSEPRPWGQFRVPEQELSRFNRRAEQLFAPLVQLRRYLGEDPRIRALWIWTHKWFDTNESIEAETVPGHDDAPRWALLQRELLQSCRRVIDWWIENRQAPSGEFGDGWGDDTDLVQNLPALVLLGDPGGRLARAAKRVADGVWTSGRITEGINTRPMGPLHAYEEGINAQAAMALIDYGNPVYLTRLLESRRTVETRLMTFDAKERRRFRSSYFGASPAHRDDMRPFDSPDNALLLHAAMALAYYRRDDSALRLAQEWVDGWLEYYAETESPGSRKPDQAFPARTRLDGTVVGWAPAAEGYGYVSLFNALYDMTGERRYREAARYWTGEYGPTRFLDAGTWQLPALELIDPYRYGRQLLRWAAGADLSRPGRDDMGWLARRRYMGWEISGNERAAFEALEAAIRKMRLTFEAFTWAEPVADRIWLPSAPLVMMTQGEISYERNQLWPRHYVSYEGFSDFSAWVRQKSETHITLWIYSFAPRTEHGRVRVWRTPPGTYVVEVGQDADADGEPDDPSERRLMLHRFAAIPLELPPGRLFALELRLHTAGPEDFWERPDLGVSPECTSWDGDRFKVVVHNLGNSTAPAVPIRVTDDRGETIAEERLKPLDAPVDLLPKTDWLELSVPKASVHLTVVVDPEDEIAELNEDNNRVTVRRRPSH